MSEISTQFTYLKNLILQELDSAITGTKDKSKSGGPDKPIIALLQSVNKIPYFYTTSSCAGRIIILTEVQKPQKKHDCKWFLNSHEFVEYQQIQEAINDAQQKAQNEIVWIKQQPPILHIACNCLQRANQLLEIAKKAGFKHSGIQTLQKNKNLLVEIIGSERVDAPIIIQQQIVKDEKWIKELVDVLNNKLKQSREKADKFREMIEEVDWNKGGEEKQGKKQKKSKKEGKKEKPKKEKKQCNEDIINEENVLGLLF